MAQEEDEDVRVKVIGVSVTQRDLDRIEAWRERAGEILGRKPAESAAVLGLVRKGLGVVEAET